MGRGAADRDGSDRGGLRRRRGSRSGRRLPVGRHTLWLDAADGAPVDGAGPVGAHERARSRRAAGGACSRRSTRSAPRTTGGSAASPSSASCERWVDGLGGSVTATLPLFAQFLDEPMLEPSPYSPASRLFWNETYIDVDPRTRARRVRRGARGAGGPVLPRADRAPAQGRPHGPSGRGRGEADGPRPPRASRRSAGTPPAGLRRVRAEPASRRLRAVPRRGASGAGHGGARGPTPSGTARSPAPALDDDRARYHLFVQWVAARAARRGGRRRRERGRRPDARPPDRGERRRLRRLARTVLVRARRRRRRPTGRVLVAGAGLGRSPAAPARARARPATATTTRCSARCSATPRSRGSTT